VRREIRDLKENYPDQWNLYLLGLGSLQWTTQSDALSYYSIASTCHSTDWYMAGSNTRVSGIHGRPFRTWANAPGLDHKIGAAGYCPHGNILFLGWHRPYLALFEVGFSDTIAV
jgi:tyrosinase